jgi:GTPase SAR1 family protein
MAVEYLSNNIYPITKTYDYAWEEKVSAASNNIYPITKDCIGVRIVVAGDKDTGKSSLIYALGMTEVDVGDEDYDEGYDTNFLSVLSLLHPSKLLINFFPDLVQATIVDTSSRYKI